MSITHPDRRTFLRNSLFAGCSVAASPLLTPVAMAAAPGDNRLIVIILRGAMDGLDVIQPYGDPNMAGLRPGLKTGEAAGSSDLDGFFALNQALSPLLPLWNDNQLAFAHAVSTPYRNKRSHFDGQDILEAGYPSHNNIPHDNKGWLNRMIQTDRRLQGAGSFLVGQEQSIIFHGDAAHSSWSPEVDFNISGPTEQLLNLIYENDPAFSLSSKQAIEIASETESTRGSANRIHKEIASFAAKQLNDQARIISFSLTGWDTHSRQKTALGSSLGKLSDVILTLKEDLGNNWQHTTVVAVTEFGRTARENGSDGTDHGTGGAMLLAGGTLKKSRVHTQWPGLSESALFENRDLMPTADVRSYMGAIVRDLYGFSEARIRDAIFPGLQEIIPRGVII